MSVVPYHRPFSAVGFRPYRRTTPFEAAQGLAGIGYLGDDAATLAQLGFSPGQVQQILAAHDSGALSDAGYNQIVSGNVSPDVLGDFLAADPGAETSSSPAPTVAAAGVPTGSTIAYQGSWQTKFSSSPHDVLAAVSQALPAAGLTVVGTQLDASLLSTAGAAIAGSGALFKVVLTLRVSGPGFSFVDDARANVDHAVYQATGKMPVSSQAVVSAVPGAGAPPTLAHQDFTTWLEDNAIWILVGIGAIVILPKVLR